MLEFVLLETELPIPAWGFGVIAFAILMALLSITVFFGRNRFHS